MTVNIAASHRQYEIECRILREQRCIVTDLPLDPETAVAIYGKGGTVLAAVVSPEAWDERGAREAVLSVAPDAMVIRPRERAPA